MKTRLLVACSVIGMIVASPAHAASLLFSFSSVTNPGQFDFSFVTDSSPVATRLANGTASVALAEITRRGQTTTGEARFYTGTATAGGGLGVLSAGTRNDFFGPQLFSGVAPTPTLLTGVYTLFTNNSRTTVAGTLTVSELAAAVPEPASWAMMIGGFALVGSSLRRRGVTRLAA